MSIFFVSDTHFGHANFLKFTNGKGHKIRPFSSVEEMDEHMIERWNSVVGPNDKVYHLGDVTFDVQNFSRNIAPRLRGNKRLIGGNHDDLKNVELTRWFQKVTIWRIFKWAELEYPFVATHVPIPRTQLPHGVKFNVHGHIHDNVMNDPWYVNLSVERTDYTPVSMSQLQTMLYKSS